MRWCVDLLCNGARLYVFVGENFRRSVSVQCAHDYFEPGQRSAVGGRARLVMVKGRGCGVVVRECGGEVVMVIRGWEGEVVMVMKG